MQINYYVYYYFLPALTAFFISKYSKLTNLNRILLIHAFIIFSVILMYLHGAQLSLNLNYLNIIVFFIAVIISSVILKKISIYYFMSSIVQEVCILLASTIIIQITGLVSGAILTSLIFATVHFARPELNADWIYKLMLLICLSSFSIILYNYLKMPLINISIHLILGSIQLQKEFFYKKL